MESKKHQKNTKSLNFIIKNHKATKEDHTDITISYAISRKASVPKIQKDVSQVGTDLRSASKGQTVVQPATNRNEEASALSDVGNLGRKNQIKQQSIDLKTLLLIDTKSRVKETSKATVTSSPSKVKSKSKSDKYKPEYPISKLYKEVEKVQKESMDFLRETASLSFAARKRENLLTEASKGILRNMPNNSTTGRNQQAYNTPVTTLLKRKTSKPEPPTESLGKDQSESMNLSRNHQTEGADQVTTKTATVGGKHRRGIGSYNQVNLYQVPHKDFFVQSMINKKTDEMKENFNKIMSLKIENTLNIAKEQIESLPELKGKTILKVKLVVVDYEGQLVYLEKRFSARSLMDSYVHVYLRTDRYSYGFSANNNKILVERIVNFLRAVEYKICVLRCRNDKKLSQKFMNLTQYIRGDCLEDPEVHILDSNEAKLIEHMFFSFTPDFSSLIPASSSEELTKQLSPASFQKLEDINLKGSTVEVNVNKEQTDEEKEDSIKDDKGSASFPKSRWLQMIEKCLAKKDILNATHEEFAKIFADFPDIKKSKALAELKQVKRKEIKGLESINAFKDLLSYQIQEDRNMRMFSKLKYDNESN